MSSKVAFDRSARYVDKAGRMHVESSHISKATVNPYYGHEIPNWETLGLQSDKIYRLLRDPVELERGAESFARIPILSKHEYISVESLQDDPEIKQLVIGAVGSDVKFNAPYLDGDLVFWDAEAIAGIETNKVRELSCSYYYTAVMEAGEYEGQPYDGRMTDIKGNHLALVEVGRAGSDVVVSDHNPFKDDPAMKMTKLGKALFTVLCAASPVLAADSALPALVGSATRKTFNKATVKAKLVALDESLDPEQLDNVLDALLDVEQSPEPVEPPKPVAEDETPAEKLRALLTGKCDDETIEAALALLPSDVAVDEDAIVKQEDVKAAMDSVRRDMREAAEAAKDVRHVVGDVAMDSAEAIYGFALDHLKVDRKGVEGTQALRALFKVAANQADAKPVKVASDSASLVERFPGAARF